MGVARAERARPLARQDISLRLQYRRILSVRLPASAHGLSGRACVERTDVLSVRCSDALGSFEALVESTTGRFSEAVLGPGCRSVSSARCAGGRTRSRIGVFPGARYAVAAAARAHTGAMGPRSTAAPRCLRTYYLQSSLARSAARPSCCANEWGRPRTPRRPTRTRVRRARRLSGATPPMRYSRRVPWNDGHSAPRLRFASPPISESGERARFPSWPPSGGARPDPTGVGKANPPSPTSLESRTSTPTLREGSVAGHRSIRVRAPAIPLLALQAAPGRRRVPFVAASWRERVYQETHSEAVC